MNRKMTIYILGRMLGVEALVLVIPALVSLIYGEEGWKAFLLTSSILAFLYLIFGRKVHGFCGPYLARFRFGFQGKSRLM